MDLSKPFEYMTVRPKGETAQPILSPDQREAIEQRTRQAAVHQWSPTLSPDNTFSSSIAWQQFRDAGGVALLCESALNPATMVEAVADIARAVLAMTLGSKYDDPKNKQTRDILLKRAPGIFETLWRHRKAVYYYEGELMDQKSSPARIHVRKYIAFMLKICCMEKADELFVLTQSHAIDLWCWCWLTCARESERDEPSAQLDPQIWVRINPFIVWARVVPQYLADIHLSALTMRLNLLLLCSNFEVHIPHFCAIMQAAAEKKIVFSPLLYHDYIEKMVHYINGAGPEKNRDRILIIGTVQETISLSVDQAPDPAKYLLDLYTDTSLTFLLARSVLLAVPRSSAQPQHEDGTETLLRLLIITQKYCMQSDGGKLRSVIANTPGFSQEWEHLWVALDAKNFPEGPRFTSALASVKQAVHLLSTTLGFTHASEDQSRSPKTLEYASETSAPPQEALVGCNYLQCPFHQDGAGVMKKCGRCGRVQYCSKTCQVSDWKVHKRACNKR